MAGRGGVRAGRAARAAPIALLMIVALSVRTSATEQAVEAEREPPAVPAVTDILAEIPRDFWHFLSAGTVLILEAGGVAAVAGHSWDEDLAEKVETSVPLNDALAPGNTYGAFSFQATIGIGAYALGHWVGGPPVAVFGADVIRAQLLSQTWAQALKWTVGRERPDGSDNRSFPSGHSASAFATAAVVQRHLGWKGGVPAMLLAAYVAAARVHDNRHHLSDVIFGSAIGIASGRTVNRYSFIRRVEVVPIVSRSSRGVVIRFVPTS